MLLSRPKSKAILYLVLLSTWLVTGQTAWSENVLVTGEPASVPFLTKVLKSRGWRTFPNRALLPGESWKNSLGERVINVSWQPPKVAVAALSDHPETVERVGQLFGGGLTKMRPVRFQYYHLGKIASPEALTRLAVTNPGSETALIHIAEYSGKPSTNYFSTGHDNNVAWLKQSQSREGEFVEIPPQTTKIVFQHELPLEKVISGTLLLSQMEGPPLSFTFEAAKFPEQEPALNNLLKATDTHSRGFYPVAKHRITRSYLAGNPELNMAVGAIRQATFSGVRELRGDYGVLWELNLKLKNPSDSEKSVDIVFTPRGGAATATLLMDQELLEIPITAAFERRIIRSILLPAKSQRMINIQTIPEGASSYPVRFSLVTK